ncbi:hypothetical protein P8452_50771 [Trifolium repens]|nr:hypothetical protein P8452_50771 [Trifolium repens]
MKTFLLEKTFPIVQLHQRRCLMADSQVQHGMLRCMQNNEQRHIESFVKVCRIIFSATAKTRYGSTSQKVKAHACRQGLQLPPPQSQTQQKPAFFHSSQRLCSWEDTWIILVGEQQYR